MLKAYIQAAMEHAEYKLVEDEEPYCGEIPACPGVWAVGESLEACRRALESTLEGWLILSLSKRLPIPEIDGISRELKQTSVP